MFYTMQHRPRLSEYKKQFHRRQILTFPNTEICLQESIKKNKISMMIL